MLKLIYLCLILLLNYSIIKIIDFNITLILFILFHIIILIYNEKNYKIIMLFIIHYIYL